DKKLNSIELTKLTSFFSLTRKLVAKRAEARSFSYKWGNFRKEALRFLPARLTITIFSRSR
ncbi:hypothetical protein OFN50_39690, partial [Escherichia coli]|nr:hypothetical protein [Escherichia coli]